MLQYLKFLILFSFLPLIPISISKTKPLAKKTTIQTSESQINLSPQEPSLIDSRIYGVAEVINEWQSGWDVSQTLSLATHIVEEADAIGVQPSLILAVIEVESSFNPCAVSSVGAKGLMQVMPKRIMGRARAEANLAFNHHLVFDPYWNVSFGIAYLEELRARFGSMDLALAAYNRGPTRLRRQLRNKTFRGCNYTRKVNAREEVYAQRTI